jgi:hypothetical protein
MDVQRSYARIWWQNDRPGLQMVSSGQLFFLFAENLIPMYREPGKYKLIKYRHKRPETAIGCHPGDIYGRLDTNNPDVCRIVLFYGEVGRSIEFDGSCLLNVAAEFCFFFPKNEVDDRVRELWRTIQQRKQFEDMKMMADSVPPVVSNFNLLNI